MSAKMEMEMEKLISYFKEKKVRILFTAILAVYFIITIIKFCLVPSGYPSTLFKNLVVLTALILGIFAYAHAIYTLRKKAIVFILLVVGVAILGEIFAGVQALGGSYYYTSFLPGPRIAGVPLFIPVIMHMTHMYLAYCVINYIFSGDRKNLWWPTIAILSVAYGSCTLAIDAGREVIYGAKGFLGVWFYNSPYTTYFGVALRTPIKWFLWGAVWLGIFLIYESRISRKIISKPDSLPVIAFFLLALTLMSEALVVGHPEFAVIQVACMLPFVIIALLQMSHTWEHSSLIRTRS